MEGHSYTGIITMVLLFSIMTSCKEQDRCEYESCDFRRPTIKVADHAKGRIGILSSQYPDTWVIISEEGIIGESTPIFDGPDIVVVCNLPDSLKINDQRVVFSGELKDSCTDFEKWTSKVYYGHLTTVTLVKN